MEFPLQRLLDVLTRVDELLLLLLKVEEQQLKLLQAISERVGAPIPPERIEEVTLPATVGLTSKSIDELVKKLAERIPQLPNRVGRIEFDTSTTAWRSMREVKKLKPAIALGFMVEEVGGGFEYIIARGEILSDPKRADVGDKWDIEFDDIQIRGMGADGTARLWYWWRE